MPPPRWVPIPGARPLSVIYPAARSGIVTGLLLAIARVSGETAPLLFTSLNNQFWSSNLNAPMANLPVVIYQFALSPYKDWQQLAWSGALLITLTILLLSIIARIVVSALQPAGAPVMRTSDDMALDRPRNQVLNGAAAAEPSAAQVRRAAPGFLLRQRAALKDINLRLGDRSITAFIGPSGCGKSTLLRVLQPHVRAVSRASRRQARCCWMARISSSPRSTWRSCGSGSAWCFRSRRPFRCRSSTMSPSASGWRSALLAAELTERVEAALRDAAMWDEVKDKLHEDGRSLSGGQQQRLCIARTIAMQPK